MNRRQVMAMAMALQVAGLIPIGECVSVSAAASVAPIDPTDPQAKRLGYVENATTVDRAANPSFSPDQKCSNCVQYRGQPQEPRGPCNVFEGKTVAAAGWCVVWGQETGD